MTSSVAEGYQTVWLWYFWILYLIFSILNIINRNIIEFLLHTVFFFNWIILSTFKLSWMKPLTPFVWTFDKLKTGIFWNRIHWHPDAGHTKTINGVVRLIMVPWSLFLSSLIKFWWSSYKWDIINTWFFVENMFIIKHSILGFHQFCCNFCCWRIKYKLSELINCFPVAVVIEIVALSSTYYNFQINLMFPHES